VHLPSRSKSQVQECLDELPVLHALHEEVSNKTVEEYVEFLKDVFASATKDTTPFVARFATSTPVRDPIREVPSDVKLPEWSLFGDQKSFYQQLKLDLRREVEKVSTLEALWLVKQT
jgi:hypothetical protein